MKGEGKSFGSMEEVISAYQAGVIDLRAKIKLYWKGEALETSAGRVLLNDILPPKMRFINSEMTKKELKQLVAEFLQKEGKDKTAQFVDELKNLGFAYVTKSGISLGMDDLQEPETKEQIFAEAEKKWKRFISNMKAACLPTKKEKSE